MSIDANLLAIVVLSRGKCGLSKCITRYMVAMAVADLLFAINEVVLNHIHSLYFNHTFLDITPVCSLRMVLMSAVTHMSVWFTVAFTFDRLVAICWVKLKTTIGIAANLLAIVVLSRGKCGLSKCITLYMVAMAVADLLFAINEVVLNKIHSLYFNHTFLDITPVCSLRLVLMSAVTHMSVWFTVAFTFDRLVAICWVKLKTISHILAANRIRRNLLHQKSNSGNDAEMENRRKSIILLFAISGSFILLWL
ncbi:probable G-protein coupled receptor 139, partial [Callorhinchus milii]|uniref:probable G-protein coupled receptor 139 n=1 Tax=Callorhinchus milii TaxID=7868 RepID=UPI001C3F5EF1